MTNATSVDRFVDSVDGRLTNGSGPVRHALRVVLRQCGQEKRSARLLTALDAALAERGISARPGLLEPALAYDAPITFSRAARTSWQPGATFPDERSLENFLVAHYRRLPALKNLKRPRRQYPLPSGQRVDLLFEERGSNALVVCELKVGISGYGAVSQLFAYIDQLRASPLAAGRKIKGLIVTGTPDASLEDQIAILAAQRGVEVRWLCYRVEVTFEQVCSTGQTSTGQTSTVPEAALT